MGPDEWLNRQDLSSPFSTHDSFNDKYAKNDDDQHLKKNKEAIKVGRKINIE
ncbi:Uncharacterised protein [Chlamydia trachomatis]|nr:Uncharacterised protein [Chlamydia trachomatis]